MRYKISVNNKIKGSLGQMNPRTNKVEINVKKHKGDRAELASTIKHELLHVKHPKMTEKQVYKKSKKTSISTAEQSKLISKLRNKSLNYKSGAVKRKFKMGRVATKPGEFISKVNENKQKRIINNNQTVSKKRVAIMGMC